MLIRLIASVLLSIGLLFSTSCSRGSSGSGTGTSGGSTKLQEVVFQSRQEIAVGVEGLRSFVLGDFSGNGSLDLLTTSLIDQRVVFLAAASPGSFASQQTSVFQKNGEPTQVVAGDFDGDMDLDFAVAFPSLQRVHVWRNDGSGKFTEDANPLTVGSALGELLAYDANGDGKVDLVAGLSTSLSLRFFRAEKQGFAAAVDLQTSSKGFLAGMASADLDGDGFPELAVANGETNEVLIYAGSKQGPATTPTRAVATSGKGTLSIAFADMDKDAKLDLLVACYGCGSLLTLQGDGKGGFAAAKAAPGDGHPVHVSVADIDADGNPDAVLSYLDRASIGFLKGDGKGGFAPERQFGTTGLPTMTRIVDLDNDGHLDVLASGLDSMRLSWIRGLGAKGLVGSEHFSTGHQAPSFTVAEDFDGDGFADTMVSDRLASLVTVLPGGADGRFAQKVFESQVGALPGHMSKGDFDRDGRQDVAVAVSGGLRLLLNRSRSKAINFELWPAATKPPLKVGTGPFEIASLDANRDGALDLMVADYGGDRVLVLYGLRTGFGFQPTPFEIAIQGGPLSLVTGDFNSDGITDAAVSRFKAAYVTVLRGDGAGQFSVATELPTGPSPNYLRKADFDGNGSEDLVVSNLSSNQLTLFLSQAIDSWSSKPLKVGKGPTALLARDLDGDRKSDILVSNADSADFYVLLGDGSGGFPIAKRFPGTWGAVSADLGDVNGDGLPDFVVASFFANRIGLYLNRSK